jgi:hypothetical protein
MRFAGILILMMHYFLTMNLLSISPRISFATALFLIFIELAVLTAEIRAPQLPFAPLAVRSIACAGANVISLLQLLRLLHLSLSSRDTKSVSTAASAKLLHSTVAAATACQ